MKQYNNFIYFFVNVFAWT